MDFMVEGINVPLAFTISAKKELTDRYNNLASIGTALSVDNDDELARNASIIGSIMARAAYRQQKAKASIFGTEITAIQIDSDELYELLDEASTLQLVLAIVQTVKDAQQTLVEVKTPKKE